MKYALVLIGSLLGGMFVNDKMTGPSDNESKTEIVYGTRIGPSGELMLVTK